MSSTASLGGMHHDNHHLGFVSSSQGSSVKRSNGAAAHDGHGHSHGGGSGHGHSHGNGGHGHSHSKVINYSE